MTFQNWIAPMNSPVTLTFRHLPRSGALEASARDVGGRLQRLNDRITACHIVFEGTPEAVSGVPFRVKIHVSVPGAQIHAESVRQADVGQAAIHSPLRSAYENAKRQLEKLKPSHGDSDLARP
jgi:ribosome-associated translation inhibitor RaiA